MKNGYPANGMADDIFKIYWFCLAFFYELLLFIVRMFSFETSSQDRKHYRHLDCAIYIWGRVAVDGCWVLSLTHAFLFSVYGSIFVDNDCRLFVSIMNGRWLLSVKKKVLAEYFFYYIYSFKAIKVIANPWIKDH